MIPLPVTRIPASRDRRREAYAWLRDPRTGGRMSMSELARRAGISRWTVLRILQGRTRPLFSIGLKIARVLEVDPWRLNEAFELLRVMPWRHRGPPRERSYEARVDQQRRNKLGALLWGRGKQEAMAWEREEGLS